MKKHFGLLATIFLMACSNGGGGGGSGAGGGNYPPGYVPENVTDQQLVQKAKLNSNQEQEIRGVFKGQAILPKTELFLIEPNESSNEKYEREQEIKNLSPTSKAIYDRIVSQCVITHPVDQTSGDISQPGGQSSSTTNASIGGAGCPISYQQSNQMTANQLAGQQDQMIFALKATSFNEMQIRDAALQNQIGMLNARVDGQTAGSMIFSKNYGGLIKSYMGAKGNIKIVTVQQQTIQMQLQFEVLTNERGSQEYVRVDFQFPSSQPTLQIFKNEKGTQFFVNGVPYTRQQIEEMFGPGFTTQNIQSQNFQSLKF